MGGFVTMLGEEAAEKAKAHLDGTVIMGRQIEVNDAIVHVQNRKKETNFPLVMNGTTHYAPVAPPPQNFIYVPSLMPLNTLNGPPPRPYLTNEHHPFAHQHPFAAMCSWQ